MGKDIRHLQSIHSTGTVSSRVMEWGWGGGGPLGTLLFCVLLGNCLCSVTYNSRLNQTPRGPSRELKEDHGTRRMPLDGEAA